MKNLAKIGCILIITIISLSTSLKAKTGDIEANAYTWQVSGYTLKLKIKFSRELYDRYLKVKRLKSAIPDVYYGQFIVPLDGDHAVSDLAARCQSLAAKTGLNEALIATSFVQSLPYNFDEVGPNKNAVIDFPYVTLYRGSGTCWDKAILGTALLRELGYSTAVIYFPSVPLPKGGTDKHVAFAIKDLPVYNIFDGYSYVETHTITPIGYLPRVISAGSLDHDALDKNPEHNKQNGAKLGHYYVYLKCSGKKL
jgi:hypothetical protein